MFPGIRFLLCALLKLLALRSQFVELLLHCSYFFWNVSSGWTLLQVILEIYYWLMLSCDQWLLLTDCFSQFFSLCCNNFQLHIDLFCFLDDLFVSLYQLLVLTHCLSSLLLGLMVQLFCFSLLHNFVVSKLSHFLAFLLEHLNQTCLDHLLLVASLSFSLRAEIAWSWGCLQVLCVISESTGWISVVACGVQILGAGAIERSIVETRI